MNVLPLAVEGAGSLDVLVNVVKQIWEWFTQMAGDLLSTPIFLISVGFFVIGGAIGLVKRIL